ncbi:unnamed protein product [Mytilus edulis]|uniref:Uncharacterized protein n=1 Tax=Mytilus edulis TaxID=6550 RepID=A0A8S3QY62_MYTED|nr:unnamed protein product [Mytilus edulis]
MKARRENRNDMDTHSKNGKSTKIILMDGEDTPGIIGVVERGAERCRQTTYRIAERAWHKCHNGCKKDLRHIFVEKRKLFDKSSQKAKRQFWYNSQEQLLDDQKRDPREFWKKIGKVGVGNERQKSIPMEVTLDDGTTSTDTNTVLNKWKNCFDKLLNCNNQTIETNGNINISDDFLDREILN